ncbi:MAG: cell division protein FtsA [Anaerolineae bacterium]|nr:cell division protein FtsA [Anaerolineae bacterium]
MVVGIDIGSSKICVLVAEVGGEYGMRIVGVGLVPARGMRKGVVVNVNEVTQSIMTAVSEAERTSGYRIERAYVGLSGAHTASQNSHGMVAVSRRDDGIALDDIDRVMDAAGAVNLSHNRELLHVIPRRYTVDDQAGVRDPLGMHGFRLEMEAHVVTSSTTALQNLVKCVVGAGVEADEVALSSLAAAHAVLDESEREMGAVLVDMGGGTTDIAIFIDGTVWHTSTLGIGGEYITSDVAIGLRLTSELAESVKIEYGHARAIQVAQDERFTVKGIGDSGLQPISRWKLAEIIEARVEEMLGMVGQEIKRSGYDGLLPAGVVLCGGVAQLPGIEDLGRDVLGLPVRIGTPKGLVGLIDRVSGPAFAVPVGLVSWGVMADGRRPLPKAGASFGRRLAKWLRALLPGQTG